MTGLALVLSCLAILVQFYGILSEHDHNGNKISEIHRFKRSHEYDHVVSESTNNTKQVKTVTEKLKLSVLKKLRDQLPPKENPKVMKHESIKPIQDKQTATIKRTDKSNTPHRMEHFFEDIDADSPIYHIDIKEPIIKEPVKKTSANETAKTNKQQKFNQIESKTKEELPENNTKESPNEIITRLRTAAPYKHKEKCTDKERKDLNGQAIAKLTNVTKENVKELIKNVPNSPKPELNCKRKGPEHEKIIEIKDHKYEEEIVRVYPAKYCQPNIKRHWEASQNFNPQSSNSPYSQAMNPYQGLYTQADLYQSNANTYNKEKYYSGYTCRNYIDPTNGNYFYANFDIDPYNQANKIQKWYQGYGNYNRIRKTWTNRQTRIKIPNDLDKCIETKINDHIITNEQYPSLNKHYQNVVKKSYTFNNNALSNNPSACF